MESKKRDAEHGAAAVEFALVVPLLLMLLFALMDMGWVFNQQLSVTAAAREGARYMAIHHNEAGAQTEAESRMLSMVPSASFSYDAVCSDSIEDEDFQVTVSIPLTDLTGWLTALLGERTLDGVGTMRCGG